MTRGMTEGLPQRADLAGLTAPRSRGTLKRLGTMRAPVCLLGCLACFALACSSVNTPTNATPVTGGTGATTGGTGGGGSGGGTVGGTGGGPLCGGGTGGALDCSGVQEGVAPLRLLTHVQYDNTVEDLLGDITHPSQHFPAENEVMGYRNNVAANQVNPRLVEAYQETAETLAHNAVVGRLDTVAPCAEGANQTDCGHAFVRDFSGRAFRRPIADDEAAIFDSLFAATLPKGYDKAVELVLSAILQSPQFLYRVDALPATPESGAVLLGSYEIASRLSYFLTNSMPDATLMQKAADGTLSTDAEIEAEARRMIELPRARAMAQDFVDQWLGLARLDGAAREAADVPYTATELTPDFQESLKAFTENVIFQDGGNVEALFTSPKMFLTEKLASINGVDSTGIMTEVDAPNERSGLLTQPAIMALFAHADQSAPVLRGSFVRERILCLAVQPPPPTVNNTPPVVDPNSTTRERFAQHTANENCAGCHVAIDNTGFGFERYDQFGRYRAQENGLDVDESGEMIDSCEAGLEGAFAGAAELSQRIAQSSLARNCLATQWYRYAMGRIEGPDDTCSLDGVKDRFTTANGEFKELLVAIALSESFRYRPAQEVAP
jgi:hypothetical protein